MCTLKHICDSHVSDRAMCHAFRNSPTFSISFLIRSNGDRQAKRLSCRCRNQLKFLFLECTDFRPCIPNHHYHTCASVLPLSHTDTKTCVYQHAKTRLSFTPPLLSPHSVSWSPLYTNITIHKACYSLYFIDSRADIKADGFSLNPLKTSDAE